MNRAFETRVIFETVQRALAIRAVNEVTCITPIGLIFVNKAGDLRMTDGAEMPQASIGGWWHSLTNEGMELWAQREGLNWLRPDGTVYECAPVEGA